MNMFKKIEEKGETCFYSIWSIC